MQSEPGHEQEKDAFASCCVAWPHEVLTQYNYLSELGLLPKHSTGNAPALGKSSK